MLLLLFMVYRNNVAPAAPPCLRRGRDKGSRPWRRVCPAKAGSIHDLGRVQAPPRWRVYGLRGGGASLVPALQTDSPPPYYDMWHGNCPPVCRWRCCRACRRLWPHAEAGLAAACQHQPVGPYARVVSAPIFGHRPGVGYRETARVYIYIVVSQAFHLCKFYFTHIL